MKNGRSGKESKVVGTDMRTEKYDKRKKERERERIWLDKRSFMRKNMKKTKNKGAQLDGHDLLRHKTIAKSKKLVGNRTALGKRNTR